MEKSIVDNSCLVSVIIPSYNSSRTLRQCLQAVTAQVTAFPYEVILVDSSDDGADAIACAEFPQVRVLHFDTRRDVGTARNLGVAEARGEIVLFIDTDCIAPPDWVAQMANALHALNADGVGGALTNGTPHSLSGSMGFYLEFFRCLGYAGKPYATSFLIGGNCGFRKAIFNEVQYTDQSVGDDLLFNWTLTQQGRRLWFVPTIAVRHLNKTGWRAVLRYQRRLGEGAYRYRSVTTPKAVAILRRCPLLVFLLPWAIIPWIISIVFRRRGIGEGLKATVLAPLLWLGNEVWAWGFYRALTER